MSWQALELGYLRQCLCKPLGRSEARRPRSGARSLLGLPFPDAQAAFYSAHSGRIG